MIELVQNKKPKRERVSERTEKIPVAVEGKGKAGDR